MRRGYDSEAGAAALLNPPTLPEPTTQFPDLEVAVEHTFDESCVLEHLVTHTNRDGIMLGNSQRAAGKKISIAGMMMRGDNCNCGVLL